MDFYIQEAQSTGEAQGKHDEEAEQGATGWKVSNVHMCIDLY